MSVILRFEGVSFAYREAAALEGLSLAVRGGEMFGLIGPDGAGKTTSLRLALGLLRPADGTVTTCGLDPVKQHRELSERVGYLSQRFSLYGDLTVDENIAFFAQVHGVRGWRALRDELLELVRMTEFRRRLADRLSGGMRQKLALACTLIHTPELLILDEPTTGVDPVSRRDFWKLLARLQLDGLTIVMTTPYLDEAERCQRVALLHRGRLLAIDDPRALQADFSSVVIELLARPVRRAAELLRSRGDIDHVDAFGERLHAFLSRDLRRDDPRTLETAAERPREGRRPADRPAEEATGVEGSLRGLVAGMDAAGVRVSSARRVPPSLEDVFIAKINEAEGLTVRDVDSTRGDGSDHSERRA